MGIDIRPLDLGDRAALERAYQLETVATREMRGASWQPLPPSMRIRRWTDQPEWTYALVGAWDGERMIGLGQRCSWEHEPDDTLITGLHVDAAYRRRGIGSAVLESLEAHAPARRFLTDVYLTDRRQVDALRDGFCARHGYRLGTVSILLETDLAQVDVPAVEVMDGWRVETYVDGIPEALLPEVGVIQGLVDEAAPSGDIALTAHVVTPEQYRQDLEEVLADGSHLVETVALNPEGRVVGWTGLTTAAAPGRPARVSATMVLEEARGHGLGMALKSAVALRAREFGVTRLATENNEANRWMLAINERQGFRPVGVGAIFQKIVG